MYLSDIKLNFMHMRLTFIQQLCYILQDGYWFVYLLMLCWAPEAEKNLLSDPHLIKT